MPPHHLVGVITAVTVVIASAARADDAISFNRDIRPILSENCYHCHGFDEHDRQADLRLDTQEGSRQVIEPGAPDDSELIRRIISDDEYELMPPPDSHKEPLSEEQVNLLYRWIEAGAEYEQHWAFVAPKRPTAPSIEASEVIDFFVGQQHKVNELTFAEEATPAKWFRRMTLDLTGLPPSVDEIKAFQKDVAEQGEAAFTAAVDHTLASPHFGERMALDWLDVARYADTNGYQVDAYRMNWPWRDWVVRAFNDNMPFDQFTLEQLAGDLLEGPHGESPTRDQLVATAFNRNHMVNGEGGAIRAENLAKTVFDRIETTSGAWLGLTMGCCQCHDHKFDPIKQTDYYAFYAFFNQVNEKGGVDKEFSAKQPGKKRAHKYMVDRPYVALASAEQEEQLEAFKEAAKQAEDALEDEREAFEPEFKKWILEMRADPSLIKKRISVDFLRRSVNTIPIDKPKHNTTRKLTLNFLAQDERWSSLVKTLKGAQRAVSQHQGDIPLVMIMRDNKSRDTFVLERGNYETPGEKVTAGVPGFLPPLPKGVNADRLALARWLISDEHPLTSRVIVNRFWQLMFGRGLVATPDDFGMQGELPSHPQLLDWLAIEFREGGWDTKAMLRSIALSRTYRQSAEVDAEVIEQDSANRWLTRGTRQRLDSRLLRDQALALAGLLNKKIGGRFVYPYQPSGIWEAMSLGRNHYLPDQGDNLYRRSLYTVWRRVVVPANFFDVPSRQKCSLKPLRTNTPLHALTLLNDTTYTEAARVWAEKLAELPNDDVRVHQAFFAATAREPNPREMAELHAALHDAREHFEAHPEEATEFVATGEFPTDTELTFEEHAAWTTVCLLVLNLDETLSK